MLFGLVLEVCEFGKVDICDLEAGDVYASLDSGAWVGPQGCDTGMVHI